MASHDYPTDFPVGLPITDAETPRANLPGATTPNARQLLPVSLPLQAGRGPFLENDMDDNDARPDTGPALSARFHAHDVSEHGAVAHWMAGHDRDAYDYHVSEQIKALAKACAALGFHMVAVDTGEVTK